MIIVFTILILGVSALIAIPLALDEELRENVTFWGVPTLAGVVIYFLLA